MPSALDRYFLYKMPNWYLNISIYNKSGLESKSGTDVMINIKIDDEGPVIVSIDTQTNEIKPQ